jgi:hypothetical protein
MTRRRRRAGKNLAPPNRGRRECVAGGATGYTTGLKGWIPDY